MNSTHDNKPKQSSGNDVPFAIGMAALVGCAIWYQKEAAIKFWLYQNLMTIVFYAFVVLAGLIAYVVHRMKRKHENELLRARAMQSVRPMKSPRNYYERRRPHE